MPEVDLLTTTAFEIAREAFLLIILATTVTFLAIVLEVSITPYDDFISPSLYDDAILALVLLKYFNKIPLAWLYQ